MNERKSIVACIQGPTASGKSQLAESLAALLTGEIVSADSMQVYRGMDIGTAKVAEGDRGVAYHCIDIIDPGEPYSAALYQRDARVAIADIQGRGKLPILCGGTGLYVTAALDDMEFAAGSCESPLRTELQRLADRVGPEMLHQRLAAVDPESAALIHPHNVRRVIRALEMHDEGESYAKRKQAFAHVPAHMPRVKLALDVSRPLLYERINLRVGRMFEEGLVDEVASLLARGFRTGLTSPQAIGYKEVVDYLDGRASLEEAMERIRQATRRYAKRQLSWLRRDGEIIWLNADNGITDTLLEQAARAIKGEN